MANVSIGAGHQQYFVSKFCVFDCRASHLKFRIIWVRPEGNNAKGLFLLSMQEIQPRYEKKTRNQRDQSFKFFAAVHLETILRSKSFGKENTNAIR
jgi:hypothetical protein